MRGGLFGALCQGVGLFGALCQGVGLFGALCQGGWLFGALCRGWGGGARIDSEVYCGEATMWPSYIFLSSHLSVLAGQASR